MKSFDACPMLESTLRKLLDKTEKTWGYFQIKKRDNAYILHLSGSNEDMLVFTPSEAAHLYRLYWYGHPDPSVFVETKSSKLFDKSTRSYQKHKDYQVCYKLNSNPSITAINKMLAELIKEQMTQFYTQKIGKDEKMPIVTLAAQ
ncbi:hypothetical protein [Kamptonema sp. UHCC 0994]|uniref:hypothetical protein n=1 Tax=Kamptonema sp. UHCC 0994 TaxID=3031329 RepID=UPI0023B9D54A|nr:hypothetical protein [Kamptonema sp. UHCC 0994]MDF0554218.1 hypothetical protein [Kamptonema sp. UHCC 0994]